MLNKKCLKRKDCATFLSCMLFALTFIAGTFIIYSATAEQIPVERVGGSEIPSTYGELPRRDEIVCENNCPVIPGEEKIISGKSGVLTDLVVKKDVATNTVALRIWANDFEDNRMQDASVATSILLPDPPENLYDTGICGNGLCEPGETPETCTDCPPEADCQPITFKPGDANCDCMFIGSDVTFTFNYLQGQQPARPYGAPIEGCDDYVCGGIYGMDVTGPGTSGVGNCIVNIADVIYMHAYFHGQASYPQACPAIQEGCDPEPE